MGEQDRHGPGVAARIRNALRPPAVVVGGETVGELRDRVAAPNGPRAVVVVDGDDTRVLDPLTVLRSRSDDDDPAVSLWCCEPAVHDLCEDVSELLAAVMGRAGDHQGHDLLFRTEEGPQLLPMTSVTAILAESNAVAVRLDSLTGLPGRVAIHEALVSALRDRDGAVAVAFIDLDDFERVNDEHGHEAGDRVLQLIARRLRNGVREGDVVGRVGGDDFLAVLSVRGGAEARRGVERLAERIAEPIELEDAAIEVAASVGVAIVADGTEVRANTVERVIADADALMFVAKQRGGGVVVEGDADDLVVTRSQLDDALTSDQLELQYQPIVPLDGSPSMAVEALVRWPLPDGGVMMPSAFVPLAEATGQVVDLDWWALTAAVVQLTAWDRSERSDTPHAVHVNLSALTLATPGLTSHIERLLRTAGIAPDRLTLEISESDVVADVERTTEVLEALRGLGLRTAVDDFGVGRASLAQLSQLPLSALKIDRAVVEELSRSEADRSIVRVVRVLADEFGLEVVAEGVESLDQADALRELGVTHAQGWLWSAAVDAAEFGAAAVDPSQVAPTSQEELSAIAVELTAATEPDEHSLAQDAPRDAPIAQVAAAAGAEDRLVGDQGVAPVEGLAARGSDEPHGGGVAGDRAGVDQVDAIAAELFGDEHFGDEHLGDEHMADDHSAEEHGAGGHGGRPATDDHTGGGHVGDQWTDDEQAVDEAVIADPGDQSLDGDPSQMPAPPTVPPPPGAASMAPPPATVDSHDA